MAQMKTQQEVQRKPTKTNQQTVANVSSASHMKSSKKSPLPKYPLYAAVPQRMTSFASVVLSVSTQLLSAAGFFLVPNGGADATRCFHCGIGLRHWSQDDDPWVEHARFSPNCDFLLNMKGQEFVNLIQLAVKYSSNQTSNNDSKPPHNTSTSTNASCPSLETEDKTRNDLVRENAELRSITKCMYCTCRDVSLVFLPCGHLISCEQCGKEQRTCRMCGCIVKGTVRTFRY
ncbi:baculoviral IAP repeat-containing protein 3-like isoform X2 [Dreissena polymorpha]|nr:baculoviral IAP repeat-containing protein 3-like isoform X2 [Dreissena polymorpha]KAH3712508.1 hypothetical protein DPMN_072258 [Dreissena polymorpha]